MTPVDSLVIEEALDHYRQDRAQRRTVDPEVFCARYPSAVRRQVRDALSAMLFLDDEPNLLRAFLPEPFPEAGEERMGYRFEALLGAGAFSQVYLARDLRSSDGRRVVVKMTTQGAWEALTLSRLSHPNIVSVLEARTDESKLTAIAMPFHGCATLHDVILHQRIRGVPPQRVNHVFEAIEAREQQHRSEDRRLVSEIPRGFRGSLNRWVLRIGAQLASTLAYVHGQGYLHGDLKPANVLLTREGQVLLLDFNLAQLRHRIERAISGTLPYLSPEQLSALRAPGSIWSPQENCNQRTDVFALGIVLYELATGQHPFYKSSGNQDEAETASELLGRQMDGPVPARERNPEVSAQLSDILDRCLAYSSEDRYPDAQALNQALKSALRPTFQEILSRHSRRALMGLVTVGILLVVLFFGVALYHFRVAQTERSQGELRFREGDFGLAEQSYHKVAESGFATDEDWLTLTRLQAQLRKWHGAHRSLTHVTGTGHQKTAKKWQVYLYLLQRDYQAAERVARLHLQQSEDPAVLNNLAWAGKQQKRWESALRLFERARSKLKNGPRRSVVEQNLAMTHLEWHSARSSRDRETAKLLWEKWIEYQVHLTSGGTTKRSWQVAQNFVHRLQQLPHSEQPQRQQTLQLWQQKISRQLATVPGVNTPFLPPEH